LLPALTFRRAALEYGGRLRLCARNIVSSQDVLIVEVRVVWDDPSRWMDHGVAKLKFNRKAGEWRLFWQRAALRWESYEPLAANRELSVLVEEIDRDPHGCFFG